MWDASPQHCHEERQHARALTCPRAARSWSHAGAGHPQASAWRSIGPPRLGTVRSSRAGRQYPGHLRQLRKPIAAICHGRWTLIGMAVVRHARHAPLASLHSLLAQLRTTCLDGLIGIRAFCDEHGGDVISASEPSARTRGSPPSRRCSIWRRPMASPPRSCSFAFGALLAKQGRARLAGLGQPGAEATS